MDYLFDFIQDINKQQPELTKDISKQQTELTKDISKQQTEIKPKKKSTLYVNNFIKKNSDKINISNTCEICLGKYTYFNKSVHNKSKRHITFLNKLNTN